MNGQSNQQMLLKRWIWKSININNMKWDILIVLKNFKKFISLSINQIHSKSNKKLFKLHINNYTSDCNFKCFQHTNILTTSSLMFHQAWVCANYSCGFFYNCFIFTNKNNCFFWNPFIFKYKYFIYFNL